MPQNHKKLGCAKNIFNHDNHHGSPNFLDPRTKPMLRDKMTASDFRKLESDLLDLMIVELKKKRARMKTPQNTTTESSRSEDDEKSSSEDEDTVPQESSTYNLKNFILLNRGRTSTVTIWEVDFVEHCST